MSASTVVLLTGGTVVLGSIGCCRLGNAVFFSRRDWFSWAVDSLLPRRIPPGERRRGVPAGAQRERQKSGAAAQGSVAGSGLQGVLLHRRRRERGEGRGPPGRTASWAHAAGALRG